MHAYHSPLRGSHIRVATALERAETELSKVVSTSAWRSYIGEWLAFTSELESAGCMVEPFVGIRLCGDLAGQGIGKEPIKVSGELSCGS